MGTPEIVTRVMTRRAEIAAAEAEIAAAKEVLRSLNQHPAIEEQAEQQPEADEICRGMRIDCEGLLNAHGIVKHRPLAFTIFGKGRVLESSILDDKGEQIELLLFSTKINPEKYSEIILGFGTGTENFPCGEPFLSLERDHGNIKAFHPRSESYVNLRRANLQDARQWKEVVDAIKQQKSSPIEH